MAFAVFIGLAMIESQAAPFVVTTLPADPIDADSAQANGTVEPGGKKARYMFQLRRPGTRRFLRATEWIVIPKGQNNVDVSGDLTGLDPETAYEYRLVAMRGTVRKNGAILTFTTPPPVPTVETGPATNITSTSATLTGTVSPNGPDPATAYFEYGTTTNYGSVTTTVQVDTAGTIVTRNISGLTQGTTYHYRIVATNSAGASFGEDHTFTTPLAAPTVTTLPATGVNSTTATLNGTVNPNGNPTTYFFQWGTTTAYGNTTPAADLPAGGSAVPVSAALSGLTPNTTYHFRLVATNAGGRVEGADLTFFTQQITVDCSESALRAAVQGGGTVFIVCDGTITLSEPIIVSRSVTLDGSGHDVTISGEGLRRLFAVSNGVSFIINNITLSDGFAASASGGAILNECGAVALNNVTLNNNYASISGGAVANVSGTLLANNCTFNGNFVIAGTTFELARSAFGGALFNGEAGTATVSGSVFVNNLASAGSAIPGGFVPPGGNAEGGAIFNAGAIAITDSSFFGNTAAAGNGALNIDTPTGDFSGKAGSDGGSAAGGAIAHRGISLSVSIGRFSENTCSAGGGGGGAPGYLPGKTGGAGGAGGNALGGALFCGGVTASIERSLFVANASQAGNGGPGWSGGGFFGPAGGKGGAGGSGGDAKGGALFVEGGPCNVTNSTIAHNALLAGNGGFGGSGGPCLAQISTAPGAGGDGGNGGDALGAGVYSALGPVSIVHGTIASNAATAGVGAAAGSGVSGAGCGQPDSAPGAAGVNGTADGAVATTGSPTLLVSTIVAYSQVPSQVVGPLSPASLTNIYSDGSGDGNSFLNTNPLLGPLSFNGGTTLTMPLLDGSPAINNADPTPELTSPVDQRGISRPQGPAPDIGAYEKN